MNTTVYPSADETLARLPRTIKRVHLIGGPGSGKSTLARELGSHLKVPVFELDEIAFEGLDFEERPLQVRRQAIHQIAMQPGWITEGIFVDWIDELLERADVILWLDNLSWYLAVRRIVTRFARLGWEEMRRQKGTAKFARFRDYRRHLGQLFQAMGTSRSYYFNVEQPLGDARHVTRAQTRVQLSKYQTKVVHCTGADAVVRFYAQFTSLPDLNQQMTDAVSTRANGQRLKGEELT